MKTTTLKLPKLALLMLLLFSTYSWAGTIKVSSQNGNSSLDKLRNAYNQAQSGDLILVDIDIVWGANSGPLVIKKNGITFKGSTKYKKFKRPNLNKTTIKCEASNIKFENIMFEGGTNALFFGINQNNNTVFSNLTVTNCYFKNTRYTGVDFRGKFQSVLVTSSTFENCPFGLQTFDCPLLKDFKISNCKFLGGDHQISLDNAWVPNPNHSNIVIEDCDFGKTQRHNIALANTQNVLINRCTMNGGINSYSQALHIEDKTKNVYVKNSNLKNLNSHAVHIDATKKQGHGDGPVIPDSQKPNYASGNVTFEGCTIESGNSGVGILLGYAKGYLRIFDGNIIKAGNNKQGISEFIRNQNMVYNLCDNVLVKGKKISQIKAMAANERNQYVKITNFANCTGNPGGDQGGNGDVFYIVNRQTGKKLAPQNSNDGAELIQVDTGNTSDIAKWTQVNTSNGFFYLKNLATGKYFRPAQDIDGSKIEQRPTNYTGFYTQWEKINTSNSYFYLKNRQTQLYFRPNTDASNSTMVQRPTNYSGNYTQWKFVGTTRQKILNSNDKIAVLKNPITSGSITLTNAKNANYVLSTVSGQTIKTGTIEENTIDVSDLRSGTIYIMQFIKDGKTQVEKIVIK